MKIEFYTQDMKKPEATALVRLLQELFGADIVPHSHARFGDLEVTYGHDPRAVDGFPMSADTGMPSQDPVHDAPEDDGYVSAPVDNTGTPWDERIHASTRTTNKDGSWTRRRNTPDAVFDAVMAELKGTAPAPAPTSEPEETNAAAAFAPVPPAPPAPAAIPTPPAPAAAGSSFVDLMKLVTEGQASGKLTKEVIDSVVQGAGAAGLGELVKPDAVAKRTAIIAQLSALLA